MLAHAMGTASSGGASNTNGGDTNYMFLAGVRDVDDDIDTYNGTNDKRGSRTVYSNADQRSDKFPQSHSRTMNVASKNDNYHFAPPNQSGILLSEKLGMHEGSITDVEAYHAGGPDGFRSQGSAGLNSTMKVAGTNPFI